MRGRLSQARRSGRGLGADRGGKARSRESIGRQQQERRHEAEAALTNVTPQGRWEGKLKENMQKGLTGRPWAGCE